MDKSCSVHTMVNLNAIHCAYSKRENMYPKNMQLILYIQDEPASRCLKCSIDCPYIINYSGSRSLDYSNKPRIFNMKSNTCLLKTCL